MRSRTKRNATAAAIAVVAFLVACVAHEVLGHSAACLAVGGRITLLTSVYFHCADGNSFVDAAGPLANLLIGIALLKLAERQPSSSNPRYFCALAAAFNLLWGAATVVSSAAFKRGDWAFALNGPTFFPHGLQLLAAGSLGLILYVAFMRAVARVITADMPILLGYLAAGLVSCLAALFFTGANGPALKEAALESFGAAAGLLILAWKRRDADSIEPTVVAQFDFFWILASAASVTLFCATLGRGFMASGSA